MRKCLYTIPAHRSLVSCVRFERTTGWYLVTSGFDLVKVGEGGGGRGQGG